VLPQIPNFLTFYETIDIRNGQFFEFCLPCGMRSIFLRDQSRKTGRHWAFGRHSLSFGCHWASPSLMAFGRHSLSFGCHSIVIRLFTAHCPLRTSHRSLFTARRRGTREGTSFFVAPLENLWVQILKFPFNYVISHNKTSKYCCFFNNKICCFCKI